jgi:hypothetical protein
MKRVDNAIDLFPEIAWLKISPGDEALTNLASLSDVRPNENILFSGQRYGISRISRGGDV